MTNKFSVETAIYRISPTVKMGLTVRRNVVKHHLQGYAVANTPYWRDKAKKNVAKKM
ncbi:MAG: hypothetical protein HWQ37_07005 [Nostoc sp. NMS4]|nr:hypothetical protein [Nostoc sp. NMS4]